MVNPKNIKTKRLSKKLVYNLRSKFEIEKLCGTNAYSLKLPPLSGKIHPVVHVSLLEPYRCGEAEYNAAIRVTWYMHAEQPKPAKVG